MLAFMAGEQVRKEQAALHEPRQPVENHSRLLAGASFAYSGHRMSGPESSAGVSGGHRFPVTHWTVVLAAGGPSPEEAGQALQALCGAYWLPIYAFIRRSGRGPDDAQDLTQGFFARVIEKEYLRQADRDRGRFRSFLLASLKHFLADEWDRSRAQKRGGGREILSLDDAEAESRYQLQPSGGETPDRIYERRWALSVMERGLARLEEEYATWGRREVFQKLRPLMAGGRDAGFAEAAAGLGLTEGAAKMTVQRMRRRYREILRDEIRPTVAGETEVDEELRYLLGLLSD